VGSAHQHAVDPPPLASSGPGTSHTHAATVTGGTSHTHTVTVNATGITSVDVTLPYVQLLACRKD
jgi:hypothetical protein